MANLKIKLVKSLNGRLEKHIATAESLGLRKIGQVTIQPDNTQTRGKIAKIGYLLQVTEVEYALEIISNITSRQVQVQFFSCRVSQTIVVKRRAIGVDGDMINRDFVITIIQRRDPRIKKQILFSSVKIYR